VSRTLLPCLLVLLLLAPSLARAERFLVEDIEVHGIRKIAIGTLLNYLPLKTGETFDEEESPRVIAELYKTGFFDQVRLLRRGNTLVIDVRERPAIASVTVKGNKEVTDDSMRDALKQIGMTKGRTYNPKLLEKLQQELLQLYYSLGKYSVRIDVEAKQLDEDRVAVTIDISEGAPARIRSINIVGNRAFSEQELLDLFKLETSDSGWFPSDKYSSVKLSGDLEALRSFYLDRGYVQFRIESKQVTITPDRSAINITINIHEGEPFSISKINLTGDLVVPEKQLKALLLIREGDVFSRKRIQLTTKLMGQRLGQEGYAFADINAIPKVNEDERTVELTILVTPGQKMTVRRILFEGNVGTRDYVLRREMRQFEGAPYSAAKLDRSKIRLQRLKFISDVKTRFERVAPDSDQMDIVVSVTERFSGSFNISAGYSEAQGAILSLGLTHDNVFGTGNRLGLTFNNTRSQEKYEISFLDPYWTRDGVSRSLALSYSKTDAAEANISNYFIDRTRLTVGFGVPLSEYNSINFSLGLLRNDVLISSISSSEVRNFIIDNNDDFSPGDTPDGDTYDEVFASLGFSKDSRNRLIFPERGMLNSIRMEVFSGDLDYYKLLFRHQSLYPVSDTVTFSFKGRIGYGKPYGGTSDLPFFEKYRAGGVRTVRGYEYNSLGPLDSRGDAYGGNLQFITNSEFLFQMDAFGGADTFRLGVYLDTGSVFSDTDAWDEAELRSSVGLSAKWFTAVGPIELSYAWPIDDETGDRTKNFQFSLGAPF